MAATSARPAIHAVEKNIHLSLVSLKTVRSHRVYVAKRLVSARATGDASPSPIDDNHLTADTIMWNAKHSAMLKKRIAQVRASELVAEAATHRPELPPVNEITTSDVENHRRLCQWHEEQYQRLRATQQSPWDDELGHFGSPL